MSTTGLTAYDSTQIDLIPLSAEVVFYYMDGGFDNQAAAETRFAGRPTRLCSLTALGGVAQGIDWEPGNVERDPVDWLRNASQAPHIFYADLSDMNGHILPRLAGTPRSEYKLFTAHPTGFRHICGPHTCGQLPIPADATQYLWPKDQPRHLNVDVSDLAADFFGVPGPAPARGKFRAEVQCNTSTGGHRIVGISGTGVRLGGPDRWASAVWEYDSETGRHTVTSAPWNAPPLGN